MKTRLIVSIILLLISGIVTSAYGGDFDGITSIEWQTVKLQENIEKKIIKSLGPIIKEGEYVIEVKLGIDKDSMEDPSSKKIIKSKQTTKVKFSKESNPKEGDDYVVLSKMGLDAPLYGDESSESQNSDVELAQKAFIEMNNRYNIFNYLKTIDINLTFDSHLNDKTKEIIRKIVQGLNFNLNEVIPQINLQYLDLKANQIKSPQDNNGQLNSLGNVAKIDKEKKELPPKWYENFKNLDVMAGLVISALIMGLFLYVITKKLIAEFNKAKEQNDENVAEKEVSKKIDEINDDLNDLATNEEDDMKIDLTKTDPLTMQIKEGTERFRKAMLNHQSDTILMLKKWLKDAGKQDANALSALVSVLEDHELAEVFKMLTLEDRSKWKSILHSRLTKEEIAESFLYISNKVVEMMLVPSMISDYETCDLLLELSPKDAVEFCEENIELGAFLTNVLSSNVISDMFKMMPEDLVIRLIDKSASFKANQMETLMPILKTKLMANKIEKEKPPFVNRVLEILPSAMPEIENHLYSTLLKYFSSSEVKVIALKTYPRCLMNNLPVDVYKQSIGLMSLDMQVQYFASLADDIRDEKLSSFASVGSKGREMIDAELGSILKNELALKRYQKDKKESLSKEFASYVRQIILTNAEAQASVIDNVENWLSEIESSSSNNLNKKVA